MKRLRSWTWLPAIALVASNDAQRTSALHGPRGLTVRAKASIAISALVGYIAIVGVFATHERAKLLHIVQQIEHVRQSHELLSNVEGGLMHCVSALQKRLTNGTAGRSSYDDISLDYAAVSPGLSLLKATYPEATPSVTRLERDLSTLAQDPAHEAVVALRDDEFELLTQVGRLESLTRLRGEALAQEYRALNSDITVTIMVASLLGFALFAVAVAWFLSRFAADVRKLEARAVAIVGGYRAGPLDVRRRDEIGSLMHSVNWMQTELQLREQRQDISREQRFHQERMAAVGSVAATVAHEVSNPLNSISGIAQHMLEAIHNGQRPGDNSLATNAQLVVRETERIGAILRQLADFGTQHSPLPELVDVNELARTTCSFVRFDRRFRNIALTLDTDPGVPAILAVADHVTQVLMNLLINAADATESLADRKPEIHLATHRAQDGVLVVLRDNGHGMTPAVLARAFEQYFTTKPPGKGRGIGLFLCKALIQEAGGRITLESTPEAGTCATVYLPARPTASEGA
jgi:two-component system, NtrC family, sensor kinase